MQTGWVMIDGKWYYFDKTAANEGKLLRKGKTPEGYHVLADGSWDGKPKS